MFEKERGVDKRSDEWRELKRGRTSAGGRDERTWKERERRKEGRRRGGRVGQSREHR